jgi:3-oxoacyl-[acyl-carrier-protein] synthase III
MIPDHIARHAFHIANNRERIEASYLKALDLGADDPAVLLLDLRDESARSILETAGAESTIDAVIAAAKSIGATPFSTWPMPRPLVTASIAEAFPDVAAVIAGDVGFGGFWADVVAEGSASAVAMEQPVLNQSRLCNPSPN